MGFAIDTQVFSAAGRLLGVSTSGSGLVVVNKGESVCLVVRYWGLRLALFEIATKLATDTQVFLAVGSCWVL